MTNREAQLGLPAVVEEGKLKAVKALAQKVRIHVLRMTNWGGSSHIGAALSVADILAVLYGGGVLRIDPTNPRWGLRDRFILSKGHAGCAVYAVLAEVGFFPLNRLKTHYQDGSEFSGHISHKGVPGVELSTGSLGHGLGVGAGMAMALKKVGGTQRVFVLMSDGELDEGSNWEAVLFSAHHCLENLVAIVDYNKLQSLASVRDTLTLEPLAAKWRSFNWGCVEVDGHDCEALSEVLTRIPLTAGRPTVVLAHTVKGKGVSFMENSILWHYRTPRGEEFEAALKELQSA